MRNFVARIKKREFEPEDLAFADEYSRAFLAEEHLEGKEVKALTSSLGTEEMSRNAKLRVYSKYQSAPLTITRSDNRDVKCDTAVEVKIQVDGHQVSVVVLLGEGKGRSGSFDLANGQNQAVPRLPELPRFSSHQRHPRFDLLSRHLH